MGWRDNAECQTQELYKLGTKQRFRFRGESFASAQEQEVRKDISYFNRHRIEMLRSAAERKRKICGSKIREYLYFHDFS